MIILPFHHLKSEFELQFKEFETFTLVFLSDLTGTRWERPSQRNELGNSQFPFKINSKVPGDCSFSRGHARNNFPLSCVKRPSALRGCWLMNLETMFYISVLIVNYIKEQCFTYTFTVVAYVQTSWVH